VLQYKKDIGDIHLLYRYARGLHPAATIYKLPTK
jgi:hypothetical protein